MTEINFPSTGGQLAEVNGVLCIGPSLWARRNIEDSSLDANGIVIGDDPGIFQTKDAIKVDANWEFAPSGRGIGWRFGETAIVVFEEGLENLLGFVARGDVCKSEFGDEAILKSTPEPFDPPASLRGVGQEPLDTEFIESASNLGGFGFSPELFFEGQILFVRDKDGVAIGIGGDGQTVRAGHTFEDFQVTGGIFLIAECGGDDFRGGIVDDAKQA